MGTKEREEAYKFYLKDDIWKGPKILRNKIEMDDILNSVISKPIHVTIDPIEVCTQQCQFCYYHGKKSNIMESSTFTGKGIIPFNRLINLIDELKESGTKCISFTGSGETLIYPNIYKIFQKILDNGIEYGVTTNLNVDLSDENVDILSKASWIRCSLNASTDKLYKEIHRPINKNDGIDRVIRNIKSLSNINISYVICNRNVHDIMGITRLAKDIGANSIFFRPEMSFLNSTNSNGFISKVLKKAKKMETDSFKIYTIHNNIKINHNLLCYHSNHITYIDAYGDIYPCCITKCDKKYAYGNIMNKNFKQFWNSKRRRENYKRINMRNCPPCIHYLDNSILELLYNNDKIFNGFL